RGQARFGDDRLAGQGRSGGAGRHPCRAGRADALGGDHRAQPKTRRGYGAAASIRSRREHRDRALRPDASAVRSCRMNGCFLASSRGGHTMSGTWMRSIAAALIFAAIAAAARADDRYPTRTITMVVPFAAGGPTDILGRVMAQAISPMLGQQVIIEDVTGAGGTIGATKVAGAPPDGYTMVMRNLGTHAASLGIYKNLAYDPRTDFEPVILVASTPMVLVTRKTLPAQNLDEVIAWAKANKGKATMGSAGVGSISHLTLLLFNHLTGADLTHVPYRGLSEATNDLLGGQIDTLFDQVVTATPHILHAGENAIVVTVPAR